MNYASKQSAELRWNKKILRTIDGDFLTSQYAPKVGEEKQVNIKKLISYPAGQGEELPKYNIICTDKTIFGLLAMVKQDGKDVHAGYLIYNHHVINDLTTKEINEDVGIGFDFGSNNTCVYYNEKDKGAVPVKFDNYRAVLVGYENEDKRAIAENNELLFFTNYPSDNGQIKSWLHEHDSRYNCYNQSEEIAGGVPVNRPNVLVKEMNQFEIKTQAGILHYNMKWLDDEKGMQKKRAFLKSLWLQTCAFLYTNQLRPEELYWSYPGSMMDADRDGLEKIYEELCKITPIIGKKPSLNDEQTTEAEAVCSYALSQDFGLNRDNMFLGIDVGGSTSDILLLANNKNKDNQATLYRESSVRLAAGVFFNAVKDSEIFRQALLNFHEGKKTDVFVANIQEILTQKDKAPYYLNCIFDQLKTQSDYDEFYDSIYTNAPFVFTIPAYVTGLLLFYSGMLIGRTIKTEHLEHIQHVDVMSFGKGGRLFHWLGHAASTRTTKEYYSSCLNAGLQLIIPDKELEVKYRDEIEVENKAEVAKGLCTPQHFGTINTNEDSDICGETGVNYIMQDGAPKDLKPEDELTGDYFDNDMNNFDFSGAENFEKFMNIFINFVSQKTNLYKSADESLRDTIKDLPGRVKNYCKKDSEYKKATKNKDVGFHYHQPIIIAEGSCFLNILIQKVFNQ